MDETLYKFTRTGGECTYARGRRWYLPRYDKPGRWMPRLSKPLRMCEYGYHLCAAEHLMVWACNELWEVDYRGDILDGDDKIVVSQARLRRRVDAWNPKTMTTLALESAERVLPIFEAVFPNDDRPRRALDALRSGADREDLHKLAIRSADAIPSLVGKNESVDRRMASYAARAASYAARTAHYDPAEHRFDNRYHIMACACSEAAHAMTLSAVRDSQDRLVIDFAFNAEKAWQSQRLLQLLGIAE